VSDDWGPDSRFLDKKAGAGALLDQGVCALTWADIALHSTNDGKDAEGNESVKVVSAHSIHVLDKGNWDVDDINTFILSKSMTLSGKETAGAVGIATTSMTLPGSSTPPFFKRLQAKELAPSVRIQGTKAEIAIPFPSPRPQELKVQWYADDRLDSEGMETEEVIEKSVKRGWGMWYQADIIARRVLGRSKAEQADGSKAKGEVIGAEETLRVLGYMDEARSLAGIKYGEELESVWEKLLDLANTAGCQQEITTGTPPLGWSLRTPGPRFVF